jgi:hypothetical protein
VIENESMTLKDLKFVMKAEFLMLAPPATRNSLLKIQVKWVVLAQ